MLDLIDTRQGTDNQHSYSNGNTLPYTGVPFGMNFFVPQTKNDQGSWFFNPRDRVFQGFRLTHQPSPWMGDFSHFLMTPVSGHFSNSDLFHYQSSYRPESAIFKPHYLQIKQWRYQITNELVPTTYGAIIRSHYQQDTLPGMFLHFPGLSEVSIDPQKQQVSGFLSNFSGCEDPEFKMYFMIQFNQPIDREQTGFFLTDGTFENAIDCQGEDKTLLLRFSLDHTKTLETKLATSFIHGGQAQLNLNRELVPYDFNQLKATSASQWEYYLNKIEVSHRDMSLIKTFYHCMYRLFLFPQKFYENNEAGEPMHYDTTSRQIKPGVMYTNNGFWDTYRSVYPLFSLIIPEEYEEMLQGFLNSYRETGYLPKWLSPDERGIMPGTLIDAVIADAANKGIGQALMPEFLEAMNRTATTQSSNSKYGRQGTEDYLKYGYIPSDHHESVNHTLDYAYSDFCISRVAQHLNQEELAHTYEKRAYHYLNLFDPETGFMRAKDKDGIFRENFKDTSWGLDYAEGSAWQSSFAVFHDIAGLIKAHGGKEVFRKKLADLCNQEPTFDVKGYGFEIHEMSEMAAVDFGQLALSNQPSFHLPYLFNYVDDPSSSQVLLKQLMTQLFDSSSTGYPGDEDNGSMSGWYIFSSMGFYPVCPGSGEYVLGIPLFDTVNIHLPNQKVVTIQTSHNEPQFNFVHQVTVNHQPYSKLFFTHELLKEGAEIQFDLGLVPEHQSYSNDERPFSLSEKRSTAPLNSVTKR
ncbi:putative alpha-1,2-mannosidase [Pullulanibacillus pueri]|uniref:Alpha-1,2-mannosidase n=1 Tax=Pullulanibacillus pueri TaxID=1437324 RepID=A0A8J2ZV78_9BACL|nr:GH92 family glycosyl hydrolase [Pullulanibacillus pueri]MBM7682082.1 putative alpha-1,2-mannosidase [Pullulanibacillus pueri]GGH80053.1 alpha-1,2-mannosidase [Pullulanibacillus pueri]